MNPLDEPAAIQEKVTKPLAFNVATAAKHRIERLQEINPLLFLCSVKPRINSSVMTDLFGIDCVYDLEAAARSLKLIGE
jgi:hypothetical protein